jgi:ADP-heptose:LPS heptosyltransferase
VHKILVVRFSALGDVALLVPVIKSFVETYRDVEVTVVTRPKFAPLFYDIERVVAFPADVDYTFTGVFGMRDLFRTLIRKGDYEVLIDFHDHIRTIILRTLFKIFGTPVIVFDKGRHEKKLFSQRNNKVEKPLMHTVTRYQKAFETAGYPFTLLDPPYFTLSETLQNAAAEFLATRNLVKNEMWIGVAPFAAHASKIYPLENYKLLFDTVLKKIPAKFFLFGGGPREIKFFESLQLAYPDNCVVVAGQLKLRQEIALMQHLDLMVCVDSANMHLAALAGVKVLSIWGGTHPDIGFSPFKKGAESIIQISRSELPCRPCSVYGRETCYVGGFPCLTRIPAEVISEKIVGQVNDSQTAFS